MKETDGGVPLHERIGTFVEDYLSQKLRENQERILNIDPCLPIEDAIELCKEANSYIDFTAFGDTELYEGYKYRIIKSDNGYLVVQGEEIDTDWEAKE